MTKTKRSAMEFCHKRAGATIDGGENRIHHQWHRLEMQIRDEGLEETVAQRRAFLEEARTNTDHRRTYDTQVSQAFIDWYEE